MNIYTELKRRARTKRDKAIQAVLENYRETLSQINRLQRNNERPFNGTAYRDRQIQRGKPGAPLARLGLAAAAERVLLEGKPLRMTELIIELQSRGYRPHKNPRKLSIEMRGAFGYHASHFVQDDSGKWRVT